MSQLFQCGICRKTFEAPEDYNDDPKTRTCIHSCDAAGEILYLGNTKGAGFYVISDDLGIKGVINPVNGKQYDSKSQYYKTVKQAGMIVVGNDAKTETRREIAGDYDCRKDIAQAIEQTGAMDKLKRKK